MERYGVIQTSPVVALENIEGPAHRLKGTTVLNLTPDKGYDSLFPKSVNNIIAFHITSLHNI